MNIIILSLFMFVFNTDASEGPASEEVPAWCKVGAAQRHYKTLSDNLEKCHVIAKKSVMLQVCHALSQQFLRASLSINLFLKADVDIILYTLSQASSNDPDELAKTFDKEDEWVSKRPTQKNLRDAFGRCVPAFNTKDIQEILSYVSQMDKHPQTVLCMKLRYAKAESQRFSTVLTLLLCRKNPPIVTLPPDSQDPESSSQVLQPYAGDVSSWYTVKSVQENYATLQDNLAHRKITVASSCILQLCGGLSQLAIFPDIPFLVQTDIKTILYILCQASSSNAEQLAQTFREEDAKVRKKETKQLPALGRCVPELRAQGVIDALSRSLGAENVIDALSRLPGAKNHAATVQNIMNRYLHNTGLERFEPLSNYLCRMVMRSRAEGSAIRSSSSQDSQPEVGAVSSALGEDPPWFAIKSTQENYTILKDNIQHYGIKAERSVMLNVCSQLSKIDFFGDPPFLAKTDIKTILYILCQKSSRNAEELAHTFRKEDEGLKSLTGTNALHAFGRCVPEFQARDVRDAFCRFPGEQMLGAQNRDEILKNIMNRYLQNRGLERFRPLAEYLGLTMEDDVSAASPDSQPGDDVSSASQPGDDVSSAPSQHDGDDVSAASPDSQPGDDVSSASQPGDDVSSA
ncbi:MAG: hypothetical protein OXC30_05450, partial [Alphaproteobacteria bacterium]|nr:hypothetical protein [Alphaproteobacteria bacterium]